MKINIFPRLVKGDLMGVAAPCARFDQSRLNQGIACLKQLGFAVRIPEQIYEKKRYLAGDDLCRAAVINQLAADPDVKGIICARGGFGAMRMLTHLDWDLIRIHPKLFVGFSDATALLTAVMQQAGISVIHGPNLVSLAAPDAPTLDTFFAAVTGTLTGVTADDGICLKPGLAKGVLAGGNLATLAHLVGTRFAPDFSGTVLFLEDVGEPAYKIDRMLSQMKMAGLFTHVSGVVTGEFCQCDQKQYLPEIFEDIFAEYNIPVLMGLASGHGRTNLSLAMGRQVLLDADAGRVQWQKQK
ncbi:MAG: LD-carboxypeptidase [Desulfotignum sp.]|nr:LD-carboxypeptidase [Desulfotignum sp.]